jgi:flagellar biosynthesis protein FliR
VSIPDFGLVGLEAQLWQILFLSIRSGAALMAAPMVGGMAVPVQLRALLCVVFGFFIATWLPLPPVPDMMSFAALLAVLQEALIGAAMGFMLQLAFAIALIAAEQIAGTMGLAIATSIDPSSGSQSGALGSYFSITMTLLFYAVGGHLLWFRLLVESHRLLPPGSFAFGADNARGIVMFMGYGFATAAAIALPVVLVLLLVQIVTGIISRSAPSLNLFALGLPAGVLAGIAALIITMPIIIDQFARVIEVALGEIAGLVS